MQRQTARCSFGTLEIDSCAWDTEHGTATNTCKIEGRKRPERKDSPLQQSIGQVELEGFHAADSRQLLLLSRSVCGKRSRLNHALMAFRLMHS